MFWVWLAVAFLSGSLVGFGGGFFLAVYCSMNDGRAYLDAGCIDD